MQSDLMTVGEVPVNSKFVTPAKAGIQDVKELEPRLREDDGLINFPLVARSD